MDQAQGFSFEAAIRDTPALSALAAEMFDMVAHAHAGARIARAASVNLDFTARQAVEALEGAVSVSKSTASVIFMSANITEGGVSVLRASALYGFVPS